jgi:hypothetical protein
VAANYNREQIRLALAQTDPAVSCYLDLETGTVLTVNEQDSSPETEQIRDQIMAAYGDRYRYISGGKANADDAAVQEWLDLEGL